MDFESKVERKFIELYEVKYPIITESNLSQRNEMFHWFLKGYNIGHSEGLALAHKKESPNEESK